MNGVSGYLNLGECVVVVVGATAGIEMRVWSGFAELLLAAACSVPPVKPARSLPSSPRRRMP